MTTHTHKIKEQDVKEEKKRDKKGDEKGDEEGNAEHKTQMILQQVHNNKTFIIILLFPKRMVKCSYTYHSGTFNWRCGSHRSTSTDANRRLFFQLQETPFLCP